MKNLIVLFCLLLSMSAYTKEIRLAVGLALPPYFLDENQGMHLDIIKAALAKKGHTLKVSLIPFGEVKNAFAKKTADASSPILEWSGVTGVCYSDSDMTYQNVAVSLKSANLKIDKVADLAGKDIIAFQDANLYLGDEYKKLVTGNKLYKEIADQETQVTSLFLKKTQVVVADINIYKFFKQNTKKADTKQEDVIHKIFVESNYKTAFADNDVCKDYNEGVKALRASGEYFQIIKKYIK